MKLLAWLRAQLQDPTNGMHALGFLTIAGEVGKHWWTRQPVDLGTIGAGMGCFTCGGVMDHFQDKTP